MKTFNLMLVMLAVTHSVSSYYDDKEENDQIVGGYQAKRGSYRFLVNELTCYVYKRWWRVHIL